jgi:hypothetical protein
LSKDTGEEAANHSSDTVELEDIHSFVNLDPPIHILAERANDSSEEANEGSNPWRDITSSWRDSYETSNGTGASTDDRELALIANVLNRGPAQDTKRGSSIGVEGGKHGPESTIERTASVEAEPSEPNEDSANEYKRRVVCFAVDFITLGKTLAEDESIRESRPSGSDVDRATSSEVE